MVWVKQPRLREDCKRCGSQIPQWKRSDAEYCGDRCRAADEKLRYKARHPDYVKRQLRLVNEIRHKETYGHTEYLENPMGNKKDKYRVARALGYRSGLEVSVARALEEKGVPFEYEKHKIKWEDHTLRTYTPDIVLDNGIIIELKGRFTAADRRKHREISKQYPLLDIRFVFENANAKINKGSNTMYRQWCERYGFKCANKEIPQEWIDEEPKDEFEMEGLV